MLFALTSRQTTVKDAPDCETCGACCCNPSENKQEGYSFYVKLLPSDRLLQDQKKTDRYVMYENGVPHMKLTETGRCIALAGKLGKKVRCTIYQERPTTCRRFESGSERCHEYRKELGIE